MKIKLKDLKKKRRREADRLAKAAILRHQSTAQRVHERFIQILDQRFGLRADYLKQDDQARLLNLWRMADQTGLTFEETLEVLLTYWTENRKSRKGSPRTMPVRVWNLTGPVARKILQDYIGKNYPGQEHKEVQRQEMRQILIQKLLRREEDASIPFDVEAVKFDYTSTRQLTDDYALYLQQEDNDVAQIEKELLRNKRPWRGSPWKE